jgi:hypothetical protein
MMDDIPDKFLEFAEPLLYTTPVRSIEILRSSLALAEAAWNLPLLRHEDLAAARARRSFEESLEEMPALGSRILRQLLEDRTTKFGDVTCFLKVRVEGENLEDVQVLIEAKRHRGSKSG